MKSKIITAVIILCLAGGGYWKYYSYKHPEVIPVEQVKPQETTPSNTTASKTGAIAPKADPIKIDVGVPIGGTYKGVIEVGASGFNAFIVNIDREKNWELKSKKFGKSLAWEGFANTDDIYNQTKDYIAEMSEMGVKGSNIHFVLSSGAQKAKGIEKVQKAIREKGFVVNAVTADAEGKYALRAALPKAYIENSYVVDIGSGNTKISWYEGSALKTVESYGAKYYALDTKPSDDVVYAAIKLAAMKVPTSKRQNCFIIGGVPFKLAEEVRNGEERFTKLRGPDEYSAGDDVKKRSGLNIYRAISDGTSTSEFVFDWDANFTIGFLLTLN